MSNKDSFTFSDKLKKSKSLPLSKRIPSKAGAQGSPKRTLIQRAQRDLPFIIVAAAALLLLPLLNSDSSVRYDENVGKNWDDFLQQSEGGMLPTPGQDLSPEAGLRNTFGLITTKSGQDTPSQSSIDMFGGDEGEDGAGNKRGTPSFNEPEPATRTYKDAAQSSMRPSPGPRQATSVGKLVGGRMASVSAGGGTTRGLAIGSSAASSGGASQREAVRPVALQPLQSAGRGGRGGYEGAYAEAARSAQAMTSGPAKSSILAAQLRDVDGSPLGLAGGFAGGPGGRVGAAGAPNNNVNYKPYLPWWWDFEKMKVQKMWELWNYNWQKALSDSLIKIATGLFGCLATGSADLAVNNFLGTPAGDDSDICLDANGKPLAGAQNFRDWAGQMKTTSGSGDSQSTGTSATWADYMIYCKSKGGSLDSNGLAKTGLDTSGKKGPLETRFRCLGARWNWGKAKNLWEQFWHGKSGFKEKDDCQYFNDGSFIVVNSVNDGTRNQYDNIAHYIVAVDTENVETNPTQQLKNATREAMTKNATSTPKSDVLIERMKQREAEAKAGECVIYIGKGRTLDSKALEVRLEILGKKYKSVRAVGFAYGKWKASELDALKGRINNGKQPECVTEQYIEDKLSVKNDKVKDKEKDEKLWDTKSKVTCTIDKSLLKTKITPDCGNNNITKSEERKRTFTATIENPGKCVYAVFVERSLVLMAKDAKADAKDYTPYTIKDVRLFSASATEGTRSGTKKDLGNNTFKYSVGFIIGAAEGSTYAAPGEAIDKNMQWELPHGEGEVYWITSNASGCENALQDRRGEGMQVSTLKNIYAEKYNSGAQVAKACGYTWGCIAELCGDKPKKTYCTDTAGGISEFSNGQTTKVTDQATLDSLKDKTLEPCNKLASGGQAGSQGEGEELCYDIKEYDKNNLEKGWRTKSDNGSISLKAAQQVALDLSQSPNGTQNDLLKAATKEIMGKIGSYAGKFCKLNICRDEKNQWYLARGGEKHGDVIAGQILKLAEKQYENTQPPYCVTENCRMKNDDGKSYSIYAEGGNILVNPKAEGKDVVNIRDCEPSDSSYRPQSSLQLYSQEPMSCNSIRTEIYFNLCDTQNMLNSNRQTWSAEKDKGLEKLLLCMDAGYIPSKINIYGYASYNPNMKDDTEWLGNFTEACKKQSQNLLAEGRAKTASSSIASYINGQRKAGKACTDICSNMGLTGLSADDIKKRAEDARVAYDIYLKEVDKWTPGTQKPNDKAVRELLDAQLCQNNDTDIPFSPVGKGSTCAYQANGNLPSGAIGTNGAISDRYLNKDGKCNGGTPDKVETNQHIRLAIEGGAFRTIKAEDLIAAMYTCAAS